MGNTRFKHRIAVYSRYYEQIWTYITIFPCAICMVNSVRRQTVEYFQKHQVQNISLFFKTFSFLLETRKIWRPLIKFNFLSKILELCSKNKFYDSYLTKIFEYFICFTLKFSRKSVEKLENNQKQTFLHLWITLLARKAIQMHWNVICESIYRCKVKLEHD